jgi:copper chaperone
MIKGPCIREIVMSVRFKVPDMACGACSTTITEAVTTLDPAAKVDADLKTILRLK